MNPALAALIPRRETVASMMPAPVIRATPPRKARPKAKPNPLAKSPGRPRFVWVRTAKAFAWPRCRPFSDTSERIARSEPGTLLDSAMLGGTPAAMDSLRRAHRLGYVELHHRVAAQRRAKP